MDGIIDYLESFTLSLELSGSGEAIKVEKITAKGTEYLFIYDRFIYNVGTLIKISFDKINGTYYINSDKYLYRYSMNRYKTHEFHFDTEEKVLNVLKHFIKIIEEQFDERANKYGTYKK